MGNWQDMLARTAGTWEPARKVVHAEFPRSDLDTTILAHDRAVIHQTLWPNDLVLAYMRDEQIGKSGVAVANVHSLPVEVVGLIYPDRDTVHFASPIQLAAHLKDRPLTYTTVPLTGGRPSDKPIAIVARVSAALAMRAVPIRMWTTLGAN